MENWFEKGLVDEFEEVYNPQFESIVGASIPMEMWGYFINTYTYNPSETVLDSLLAHWYDNYKPKFGTWDLI